MSALVALRLASPATATLSFALLGAYALLGRRQAIHALLFSWLFLMLNPAIAPTPPATTVMRYLVLLCAAASVLLRSPFIRNSLRMSRLFAMTMVLGIFIVLHSILISPEPTISVLKGVAWTLAIMTSLAAWEGLTPESRNRTANEIFLVLLLIAFTSLLLLPAPVSYMPGKSLFRGVLGHSQALGPTLAVLAAWTSALLLQRASWPRIVILTIIVPLIFLTGARTALLAAILGLALGVVFTPALSRQRLLEAAPALKSRSILLLSIVSLLLASIWMEAITSNVSSFLNKGRQADSVLEAYEESRGDLINVMLANIRERPMFGIGFGIASDPNAMEVERFAGIPVSAAIEKGVTPIAILEELGIVGSSLIALWGWYLVVSGARGGLAPLACLSTILALNLGESSLFSSGGMGMLSIVMIGWIVSSARSGRHQRGAT
ncbi:hypothetical protein HFP89_14785 [Wenzhouxiangella sp. XN79A]|uniref:O-antigen ligase family protein n=1 Tax=Wenzhouxiangella sp. XN79A TaxID=2724193 RepID=UPI00144AB5D7|nr:O-antigen ligase family protein [Wenzhouxiangella sp. XN79A]NKI36434.1 hypothetical protein [Wenzhouxiangella sp. XN79A]